MDPAFVPKVIFLADDDTQYRETTMRAMREAGHQVVVVAANGAEAMAAVPYAVDLGVNTAILDRWMPHEDDGPMVAGALNAVIPQLLVVSVSGRWGGATWPDPNYLPDQPHPNSTYKDEDVNGRTAIRFPDFHAKWVEFDPVALAQEVGTLQFSLQDTRRLAALNGEGRFPGQIK